MDIYKAAERRYSCRLFANAPVDDAVLTRIIDAARNAPSAKNMQQTRIIAVRDERKRKKLAEAARNQSFVGEAPVVLVFCSTGDTTYTMTCGQLSYPIDAAIMADHVSLLAAAEGLGTCWVGAFFEEQVKELLGLPEGARVVSLMPLGVPGDTQPAQRNRLPLSDVLRYDKW